MNANLAQALQLLDITAIKLLNDQGVPVHKVSAKEHGAIVKSCVRSQISH